MTPTVWLDWPPSWAAWNRRLPTSTVPARCARLVERGDVLVTTVGPYLRFGEPALDAAVGGGAHYFDATGRVRSFVGCSTSTEREHSGPTAHC